MLQALHLERTEVGVGAIATQVVVDDEALAVLVLGLLVEDEQRSVAGDGQDLPIEEPKTMPVVPVGARVVVLARAVFLEGDLVESRVEVELEAVLGFAPNRDLREQPRRRCRRARAAVAALHDRVAALERRERGERRERALGELQALLRVVEIAEDREAQPLAGPARALADLREPARGVRVRDRGREPAEPDLRGRDQPLEAVARARPELVDPLLLLAQANPGVAARQPV